MGRPRAHREPLAHRSTYGHVTATLPIGGPAAQTGAVTVGRGSVWVVYGDSTLAQVDPRAVRVSALGLAGSHPAAIAFGHGLVWVANTDDNNVQGYSPASLGSVREAGVGLRTERHRVRGRIGLGCEHGRRHRHAHRSEHGLDPIDRGRGRPRVSRVRRRWSVGRMRCSADGRPHRPGDERRHRDDRARRAACRPRGRAGARLGGCPGAVTTRGMRPSGRATAGARRTPPASRPASSR